MSASNTKTTSFQSAFRSAVAEKERQENQETIQPENHNTSIPVIPNASITEPVEAANLTIKVSKRQRRHWLIEAKKQDTSLTAAIVEALNARFGQPEQI